MAAGPVSYGQQWTLEAGARANVTWPAASLYISDLVVYAFHAYVNDPATRTLAYDVSTDGGQTFPVVRQTAYNQHPAIIHCLSIRSTGFAGVPFRVILETNPLSTSQLLYSDDVLTVQASTWTAVPLVEGNKVGGHGFEVSGATVLAMGETGDTLVKIWRSTNGGATFGIPVTVATEQVINQEGRQILCSGGVGSGIWCFLNPKSGAIYRSTDDGVSWGTAIKTITPGNATLGPASCIFAVPRQEPQPRPAMSENGRFMLSTLSVTLSLSFSSVSGTSVPSANCISRWSANCTYTSLPVASCARRIGPGRSLRAD